MSTLISLKHIISASQSTGIGMFHNRHRRDSKTLTRSGRSPGQADCYKKGRSPVIPRRWQSSAKGYRSLEWEDSPVGRTRPADGDFRRSATYRSLQGKR